VETPAKRTTALEAENAMLKAELHQHANKYNELLAEFNILGAFSRRMQHDVDALRETIRRLEEQARSTKGLILRIAEAEKFFSDLSCIQCPVTLQPMDDPVGINCGHVFERSSIEQWLETKSTCPVCRVQCFLSSSYVMDTVLSAIAAEKTDPLETVQLYDQVRAQFECTIHCCPMRDPVLTSCGVLMDRDTVDVWGCPGCDFDYCSCKPMPPFLQEVWSLLKAE